jgi:hypothetical protein
MEHCATASTSLKSRHLQPAKLHELRNHFLIPNRDEFGVVNAFAVRASVRLFSVSSGYQRSLSLAFAAVLAPSNCA